MRMSAIMVIGVYITGWGAGIRSAWVILTGTVLIALGALAHQRGFM